LLRLPLAQITNGTAVQVTQLRRQLLPASRQLRQRHKVRAGHVTDEVLGRLAHIDDRATVGLRGPELLQVCFLYHNSS
jgi:hypothetical protein